MKTIFFDKTTGRIVLIADEWQGEEMLKSLNNPCYGYIKEVIEDNLIDYCNNYKIVIDNDKYKLIREEKNETITTKIRH